MARHHISDPRVQAIIGRLADQFVRLGSVNALADALTSAQPVGSPRIYPNRLHGLLSEDQSRSTNTATMEAIDRGLAVLESAGGTGDGAVRQRVMAASDQMPPGTADPAGFIAAATGVPPAVVKRVTESPGTADEPGQPQLRAWNAGLVVAGQRGRRVRPGAWPRSWAQGRPGRAHGRRQDPDSPPDSPALA